jgi:hypothetical protein
VDTIISIDPGLSKIGRTIHQSPVCLDGRNNVVASQAMNQPLGCFLHRDKSATACPTQLSWLTVDSYTGLYNRRKLLHAFSPKSSKLTLREQNKLKKTCTNIFHAVKQCHPRIPSPCLPTRDRAVGKFITLW